MPTVVFETWVAAPVEKVWDFHSSALALKVLTPPGRDVQLVGDEVEVKENALHTIRFRQFGIPLVWRARIFEVHPPYGFHDRAESGPFPLWVHHHEFVPDGEGTLIRDTLNYTAPGWILSPVVDAIFVRKDLVKLFEYRHKVTRDYLESV